MAKDKEKDEVAALFELPLAEFTAARNALAGRLKKAGKLEEAEQVKALAKPSISAWAVNQLYWGHREAFDRLIEAGRRFRNAQAAQLAGKSADARIAGDERRQVLSDLARLAAAVMRDGGHNPTPDAIRRITTTLEALSAYESLPDAALLGQLTEDMDPPGFEALAALIPGPGPSRAPSPAGRVTPFQRPGRREPATHGDSGELTPQDQISEAKVALREAERALDEVRVRAQRADAASKRATAHLQEAEKSRIEAEERLRRASAAFDEAVMRARTLAAEADEASRAVAEAERLVERATQTLQSLG